MANENSRETEFSLVFSNHAEDRIPPDDILTRGWLIKKNDLGVCHEGPTQGHPFLHAS